MNRLIGSAIVGSLVFTGCAAAGTSPGINNPSTRDAENEMDAGASNPPSECKEAADKDRDGLADFAEGVSDIDHDGVPNDEDADSDADGIGDDVEQFGAAPCFLRDTDEDGIPDVRDLDSDNDGLSDSDESTAYHTDPRAIDSDGDGITDLAEVRGSGTDPLDASSTISERDFFIVLPSGAPTEHQSLRFETDLKKADIYYLVDTTGSMQSAIDNVEASLSEIASDVGLRIPDVEMGVGYFQDFPFSDSVGNTYGSPDDVPFGHALSMTSELNRVRDALASLTANGGGDGPESSVEALYQLATGRGGRWVGRYGGEFELDAASCTHLHGFACFRDDSLPIVVHVTDTYWHNGLTDSDYQAISPAPHSFDEAANALNEIGAKYIGITVNGGGSEDAVAMARATRSVTESGDALVYDATDGTVSTAIIEAIERLSVSTPQDISTRVRTVRGNPDDFDASAFIVRLTPQRAVRLDGSPGYASKDEAKFYGVVPGTEVEFDVGFANEVRAPASSAQIFRAVIEVVANDVSVVDTRNVYIIVPADGQTILI